MGSAAPKQVRGPRTERAIGPSAPPQVASSRRDDQGAVRVGVQGGVGYGVRRRNGVVLSLSRSGMQAIGWACRMLG